MFGIGHQIVQGVLIPLKPHCFRYFLDEIFVIDGRYLLQM